MKNKPTSSQELPKLHEVKLIDVHGIEGMKRRFFRKIKKATLIGAASTMVSLGASHEAREYTRSLTGYAPETFRALTEERKAEAEGTKAQEGMLSKAYEWIQGTASVTNVAEASRTYKEIKYQYYTLLSLVDDTSYWGAFILTFYAMAKMLKALDELTKKGKEGIDPDMKINQDRLASTINAIGKDLYALQRGELSEKNMEALVSEIQALKEEMENLEKKLLS